MSSTHVYVLLLENGKIYVGNTKDLDEKIRAHFRGHGSEWTQMHPPVAVLEIRENVSLWEVDVITRRYMDRFGWHNVCGSSYNNHWEQDLDDTRLEFFARVDNGLI